MSGKLSKKLQRLDDFLSREAVDDDAMLLSELDGFLAGLIVCPEMIAPSEWLPFVWGEDSPVFDSQDQAQSVIDLIMWHYNDIIRQLDHGKYRPVYGFDIDDSIFWEIWIEGFWRAMRLRPGAWEAFARDDENEDLQRALFVLVRLGECATLPADFKPMELDEELEEIAPDIIPSEVEILHRARLELATPFAKSANENLPKAGRNDPCPCGSSKKYKKCCLH